MVTTRTGRKRVIGENGRVNGGAKGRSKSRGRNKGRSKSKTPTTSRIKNTADVDDDKLPLTKRDKGGSPSKSKGKKTTQIQPAGPATWAGLCLLLLISVLFLPPSFEPPVTLLQVFYFGWITALSTGLGVLPLVVFSELSEVWLGVSDAIAGGMMIAASGSLCYEGIVFDEPRDITVLPPWSRVVLGISLGAIFILSTKAFLEANEELKISGIQGNDAKRVMLIIIVMTLHSFSEGLGIGVSFGGEGGGHLGAFISASLAVHNVPEGLATAIVLYPKGLSLWTIGLWCVCTSLPQPVMAVPSYLMVELFIPILPIGLGFAGGAMFYVAYDELIPEAKEKIGRWDVTAMTGGIAAIGMLGAQLYLHD